MNGPLSDIPPSLKFLSGAPGLVYFLVFAFSTVIVKKQFQMRQCFSKTNSELYV